MTEVKHYFVGTLGIGDYYSASLYEQQALELLEREFQTHDYALLSGGSMMYIDAVCNGIDDIPTIDDETRETMKRRLKEEGLEALCVELHGGRITRRSGDNDGIFHGTLFLKVLHKVSHRGAFYFL